MATFKLPATELSKLQKYKRKLLEQQRKLDRAEFDKLEKDDQDISIHEAIEKSSQISQVLETLEPKEEQIATSFKGAVTTAGGRELPLTEPVFEKKEPTRQSFLDAFKLAAEHGLSTPKKLPKPLGDKELKSRNFLDKWGIDYDENLTADANITDAVNQVFPHQREEFMTESEALFAKPEKPKKVSKKTAALDIVRTQKIKQYHEEKGIAYDDDFNYVENIQGIANNLLGQEQIQYMDDIEKLVKDKEEKPRLSEQTARNKLNTVTPKIIKLKQKMSDILITPEEEKALDFHLRKFNEWLEFIPEGARDEYMQDVGEKATNLSASGYSEGATATNPTTGERIVVKDGQWQPL